VQPFSEFIKAFIHNEKNLKAHIGRLKHFGTHPTYLTAHNIIMSKKAISNACANTYIKTIKLWGKWQQKDWTKQFKCFKEDNLVQKVTLPNREIEAIVAIHTYPQMDMFFKLFAYHPFRISELLHCTKGSINFQAKTIYISKSKTYTRNMKIVKYWDDLEKYAAGIDTQLLFPAVKDPLNPPDQQFANQDFSKRLKMCGIKKRPGLTVNSLRHSTITDVLTNGGNLLSTMRMAGHKSPQTTNKYFNPTDDQNGKELEKRSLISKNLIPTGKLKLLYDRACELGIDVDPNFNCVRSSSALSVKIKQKFDK
jgi:integrase